MTIFIFLFQWVQADNFQFSHSRSGITIFPDHRVVYSKQTDSADPNKPLFGEKFENSPAEIVRIFIVTHENSQEKRAIPLQSRQQVCEEALQSPEIQSWVTAKHLTYFTSTVEVHRDFRAKPILFGIGCSGYFLDVTQAGLSIENFSEVNQTAAVRGLGEIVQSLGGLDLQGTIKGFEGLVIPFHFKWNVLSPLQEFTYEYTDSKTSHHHIGRILDLDDAADGGQLVSDDWDIAIPFITTIPNIDLTKTRHQVLRMFTVDYNLGTNPEKITSGTVSVGELFFIFLNSKVAPLGQPTVWAAYIEIQAVPIVKETSFDGFDFNYFNPNHLDPEKIKNIQLLGPVQL